MFHVELTNDNDSQLANENHYHRANENHYHRPNENHYHLEKSARTRQWQSVKSKCEAYVKSCDQLPGVWSVFFSARVRQWQSEVPKRCGTCANYTVRNRTCQVFFKHLPIVFDRVSLDSHGKS